MCSDSDGGGGAGIGAVLDQMLQSMQEGQCKGREEPIESDCTAAWLGIILRDRLRHSLRIGGKYGQNYVRSLWVLD